MTDQPPVPWDQVPGDAQWVTLDRDGHIDTWLNKPILKENGSYWFSPNMERDHISGFRVPDGGDHQPQIWRRP